MDAKAKMERSHREKCKKKKNITRIYFFNRGSIQGHCLTVNELITKTVHELNILIRMLKKIPGNKTGSSKRETFRQEQTRTFYHQAGCGRQLQN